jgi:hypothetical protein
LPSADGSGSRFVMGYEKAFSGQLLGGVTLGYGHSPFDLGNNQGTVKTNEWELSAFAAHKAGNYYANAVTTYSWLDYTSTLNATSIAELGVPGWLIRGIYGDGVPPLST